MLIFHKKKKSECSNCPRKKQSLVILHDYLGHVPDEKRTNIVEGTIFKIARLEACNATDITCITENDNRGVHRQK